MTRITDSIAEDHKELKEQYENVKSAKDSETKTKWRNQFTWELARHSIGEELVVYPAMEKYLGTKGKQLTDRDRSDHQTVRN